MKDIILLQMKDLYNSLSSLIKAVLNSLYFFVFSIYPSQDIFDRVKLILYDIESVQTESDMTRLLEVTENSSNQLPAQNKIDFISSRMPTVIIINQIRLLWA